MNQRGKDRRAGDAGAAPERRPAVPREVGSQELLGNCGSVHIRHGCEVYTLRRTSNGKLILTK